VTFGNTPYGYTNLGAISFGIENLQLNKLVDQRSGKMMLDFFDEIIN